MRFTVGLDRTVGRLVYRMHLAIYRLTRGFIGHRSPLGPILVLTTRGRRSGLSRSVPLLYFSAEGRYFVVSSNGGRAQAPSWFVNIRDDGHVVVQVGPRRFAASSHVVSTSERERLWPVLTSFYPGWAHYQTLTQRTLNVVEIVPENGEDPRR